MEIVLTVLTLLLFVFCIWLTWVAAKDQMEGIVILGIISSIVVLILGGTLVHETKISKMKSSQYSYEIQYNDTIYYTNDYILSNSGIEFEAEEGHFIYPIEGQELKINKTKKGDQ